ncbi:hypothetical protein THAOC_05951 [Thalassiosira oceanica]|uniref:Uncharacterized protein n=1 Tax=Thalassiosira oceanica TaxID=159749 RepID=K0T1J1_THAOC|nr:hypothetical protein THAOC_05951 [Thalassiosira oceanica]|eukprot:EJK72513.1 hypothetical protein THAOC_05951 [Thalassiosira oceanica]
MRRDRHPPRSSPEGEVDAGPGRERREAESPVVTSPRRGAARPPRVRRGGVVAGARHAPDLRGPRGAPSPRVGRGGPARPRFGRPPRRGQGALGRGRARHAVHLVGREAPPRPAARPGQRRRQGEAARDEGRGEERARRDEGEPRRGGRGAAVRELRHAEPRPVRVPRLRTRGQSARLRAARRPFHREGRSRGGKSGGPPPRPYGPDLLRGGGGRELAGRARSLPARQARTAPGRLGGVVPRKGREASDPRSAGGEGDASDRLCGGGLGAGGSRVRQVRLQCHVNGPKERAPPLHRGHRADPGRPPE